MTRPATDPTSRRSHSVGRGGLILCLAALTLGLVATPARSEGPWLDEGFEGGTSGVFDEGWGIHSTSEGHVGSGLLSRIPQGDHWGSSAWWYTADHVGHEPEEMWLRYYLRFPEGFRVNEGDRGKLPGLAGLYGGRCRGGDPSTPSAPCWSARMLFSHVHNDADRPSFPYDPEAVTRLGFYPYLLDGAGNGQSGQVLPWDADLGTLHHGRWYCVEAHVEMNTPGQSDGVLEGFVDGSRAFSRTDLSFRRSGEGEVAVESVWFDVYYGGSVTSPADNSISFDSLAAGPERIGCNDNPAQQGRFHDDDGSVFEGDIERLAASGITRGCNPPDNTRFCPTDPVTRGQMAAFLHRALEDRLEVTPPVIPGSPPDLWGMYSSSSYTEVLEALASAGAPLDVYAVAYPIDATSGDKDWMASGSDDNPNKWVPIQLERIWQRGATPHVQVTVADLAGLTAGHFDTRIDRMLGAFGSYLDANPGSRLVLDILPEANRKQKPYGDDPARFRSAFRSLAGKARAELGPERVRIAFSGHREMSSDRFAPADHPPGGYSLWWPGADVVDVAAVRGHSASASTDPAALLGPALASMAEAAGSSMPLVAGLTAAPADPSRSAQVGFLAGLADLTRAHPQLMGVLWDDVVAGDRDLRLTSPSLPAGVDTATADTRTGGMDWLFSGTAEDWRRDRRRAEPFSDALDSVFSDSIRWLAASGITKGCNPPDNTLFCPREPVTRGQMAAFLVRALDLPAGEASFTDTSGHVFAGDVAALAGAGITKGCDPPHNSRFCPDDPVTRGQMAAFLVRAGLTD